VSGFAVFLSCCKQVSGVHIEKGHIYEPTRLNILLDVKTGSG
jgi:hypothetical protein